MFLLLCFVNMITCGLKAALTANASDYPPQEDSQSGPDLTLVISSSLPPSLTCGTHAHGAGSSLDASLTLPRTPYRSTGLISIQALTSSSDNDNDAHLRRRAAIHGDRFSSSNCLMVQCSMRLFITRGVHPPHFTCTL